MQDQTRPRRFSALAAAAAALAAQAPAGEPAHFLYSGDSNEEEIRSLLKGSDIEGVQVIYSWRRLEPRKGEYDFSAIERDLAALDALGKKLFIQIQDRFFQTEARNIPDYLLDDPHYGGGLVAQIDNPGENLPKQQGWVSAQWNPALRARFQALLAALGDQFDGRIYGINLPESSADIDQKADDTGFTCDAYFEASLENIQAARNAFEKSHVVQYTNFWPCEWNNDKGYMGRIFEDAAAKGYGLGGPDIVPHRRAQMKNSYPFFNAYKDRLPIIAMAIQEPTLTYRNPETGKRFTREEFVEFASGYLGVDVIFWTTRAPWLRETKED